MSAPILWIVLPGLFAFLVIGIYRFRRSSYILALVITALLAILAFVLPIKQTFSILPWNGFSQIQVSDTMTFLGREFVIGNSLRPAIIYIYLSTTLWLIGAYFANCGIIFPPCALATAALLTASLSVKPFLYAAIMIEGVALICVPLLSPPGKPVTNGILRFLTFQTTGIVFLLFSGWMVEQISINPANSTYSTAATILLGLGFMLILGGFPFNSWISMVAEKANVYSLAFVFFTLTGALSLLAINFLSNYEWLQQSPVLFRAVQLLGWFMIIVFGVWATFQKNLGRIFGFAMCLEIGFILLAISLAGQVPQSAGAATSINTNSANTSILFFQLLPRGVSLALWAFALSIIQDKTGSLNFESVRGISQKLPFACISIGLANLAVAGLPLLAEFPIRLALWFELFLSYPTAVLLSILGCIGLMVAGVRSLVVLTSDSTDQSTGFSEKGGQVFLLISATIALFTLGIFPQWFLPYLARINAFFSAIKP